MKKNVKTAIGIILLIAIAAVIVNISNVPFPKTSSSTDYDAFAKCLTENKAVLYGAFWCPHCQTQKKMFGSSIEFIKYVECSTPDGKSQTEICKQEGVTAYPTWKFNGKVVEGGLDFAGLSENSGCSLDLIK